MGRVHTRVHWRSEVPDSGLPPHACPPPPHASFPQAKDSGAPVVVVVDKEDVLAKLGDLLKKQDLSRYVL